VTSGGKPVDDPADFGNSWAVDAGKRRRSTVCTPELVMGHFFKTQPNPKFLDPTQPTKVFTRPNPTHYRHGILGYTENFLQQLLHVTDKFTDSTFYKPTVNERYYSAIIH